MNTLELLDTPSSVDFNLKDLKYVCIQERPHYDIQILSIGQEYCSVEKPRQGPKRTRFFSLHYVVSGKGYFTSGSKTYNVSKNTFFLQCPNQTYSYVQDTDEPWCYYWITFNGLHCKELVERCFQTNEVFICDSKEIQSIFQKMIRMNMQPSKRSKDLCALSALYRILEIILDMQPKKKAQSQQTQTGENHVIAALEIINSEYNRMDLSTSLISKRLNIHPNYFSSVFRKNMNMPFTRYLTVFRLNIACNLLKQTNKNIAEIATEIGFSDPLYFSRQFKSYFKFSPQNYRKEVLLSNQV